MEPITLDAPASTTWRRARETVKRLLRRYDEQVEACLGGGSVLAARWGHRHSNDIDIRAFGRDDLADLTRQNQYNLIEALGGIPLRAEAQLIACLLGDGKLDVSATHEPMDGSHREEIVDGQAEKVLTTAQILYRKLDRGTDALVRDAFDLAVAAKMELGELAKAWNAFPKTQQEAIISALESTARRNADGYHAQIDDVPERFEIPPDELNARAILALHGATYTQVGIRITDSRTIIDRKTRAEELAPEVHETTDVRRVLRHTGVGVYIADIGEVEEANLVHMARLMQDDAATGVVYDTADENRVQRLISAPHKYWSGKHTYRSPEEAGRSREHANAGQTTRIRVDAPDDPDPDL